MTGSAGAPLGALLNDVFRTLDERDNTRLINSMMALERHIKEDAFKTFIEGTVEFKGCTICIKRLVQRKLKHHLKKIATPPKKPSPFITPLRDAEILKYFVPRSKQTQPRPAPETKPRKQPGKWDGLSCDDLLEALHHEPKYRNLSARSFQRLCKTDPLFGCIEKTGKKLPGGFDEYKIHTTTFRQRFPAAAEYV